MTSAAGPGPEAGAPSDGVGEFEALYRLSALRLVRQTYLLTGQPGRAAGCVDRAFELAWARWTEVSADASPEGWIRATAFDLALSPWTWTRANLRLRRPGSPVVPVPVHPEGLTEEDRVLVSALLRLPRAERRALVLHDAVGLDWKQTSTEVEATTPAAYGRVVRARESLAENAPAVVGDPLARGFGRRLGALLRGAAVRACPQPAHPAEARVRRQRSSLREGTVTAGAGLATLAVAGALTAALVWGTPFHPPRMPFVTYDSTHGGGQEPAGPSGTPSPAAPQASTSGAPAVGLPRIAPVAGGLRRTADQDARPAGQQRHRARPWERPTAPHRSGPVRGSR